MKTIYVKGRTHYKKYVRKAIAKSKLREGQDVIEGLGGVDYALYWISEDMTLKELKLAITAKVVWKYRLRFFEAIEEMSPKKNESGFDESEMKLLNQIKKTYATL